VKRLFLLLAILGGAAVSEAADRRERPLRTEVQCAGTPTLPEMLVATNATPAGPLFTGALALAPTWIAESVDDAVAPSKIDRGVYRIDAQIFEKYLAFRESLTCP
jgi:hypothetical protein